MRRRPVSPRLRRVAVGVAALVVGFGAAACSDDGGDAGSGDTTGGSATSVARSGDAALRAVLVDQVGEATDEPGCAASVLVDGEVVAESAVGLADLAHRVPIAADTAFDIGSVSKQLTAAVVVLLAADGEIDLGADLHTYVPSLPDYGATVTVEQAMHHATGIPDYTGPLGEGFADADHTTQEAALALIELQPALEFAPGGGWSYSNTNYLLLAEVVEAVTRQPFEAVLVERLGEPLGLDSLAVRDDIVDVIPHAATAYAPGEGGSWGVAMTDWVQYGDGAAHLDIADLAAWQAALESGDVAGVDLWAALAEGGVDMGDGRTTYARGLTRSESDGLVTLGHAGTSAGYRSALLATPDEGVSAAVLCNRSDVDAEAIARAAIDAFR